MATLNVDNIKVNGNTISSTNTDGNINLTPDGTGSVVASKIDNTTLGSNVVFPAGGTGNPISVAIICDQKAQNTNGGTFSSGSWHTRNLNTEISDPDGIVSVNSSTNQFTLTAGTYLIEWSCPAYNVTRNQSRLYNVTGTAILASGSSEYSATTYPSITRTSGGFIHTIAASNIYEIQHRCETSSTTFGFGVANNFAEEIYTIVKISKLK